MSMYGWENQDHPHSPQNPSDHSVADALSRSASLDQDVHTPPVPPPRNDAANALIDPALRDDRPKQNSSPSFINVATNVVNHSSHPPDPSMPHRVDPYPMSAQHRRDSYDVLHRRPSPPPIATLNHSPSPSIPQDRSAMSTPPARRTPPQPLPSAMHTPSYYSHDPVMIQSSRHHPVPHFQSRTESMSHSYGFSPHPSFDHRYEHGDGSNHPSYHNSVGMPSHAPIPPVSHLPSGHIREAYSHPYPLPGQASVASIYTDDANTKLSDRVRRRCFNCCTTDTSTWRRSNLSPGKVLCNKCGLFERTHSRPRPEQFPHKRGPLTGTALNRSRTPPSNQLPPISPPYSYSHPSIAPLNNVQDHRRDYQMSPLPGLQTWHPNPTDSNAPSGSVVHVAPISLPPPNQHHGQQNGQHQPPIQQAHAPQQAQTPSQSQQLPPPPVRRDTGESSPGARPASPPDARSSSNSQDNRDSPKSVA